MTEMERERFYAEARRSDRVLSARAAAHFAELALRKANMEVYAAESELMDRIEGEG